MENLQLTPLEKLIAERSRVQKACYKLEESIEEDINYIRKNMAGLAFAAVTSAIKSKFQHKEEKAEGELSNDAIPEGFTNYKSSDYWVMAKNMLPLVWSIARPILFAWGVKFLEKWVIEKFIPKKKEKTNN